MAGTQSFVAGTKGYVQIGTLTTSIWAYKKWTLAMKAALPKMNNFLSVYQRVVGGVLSGTLTLEGPYDTSGMGNLVPGLSYQFVLGLSSSISFTITAIVGDTTPSDDIDDAPRVTVSAETDGTFTIGIT